MNCTAPTLSRQLKFVRSLLIFDKPFCPVYNPYCPLIKNSVETRAGMSLDKWSSLITTANIDCC